MQNSHLKYWMIFLGLSLILGIACNEQKPKGDEFAWSPDGKKLALINVEARELLLLSFNNQELIRTQSLAQYSGENAKIYTPVWSHDSQYLAYSQTSARDYQIHVYRTTDSLHILLDKMTISPKTDLTGKILLAWSPRTNALIWQSWDTPERYRLFQQAFPASVKKQIGAASSAPIQAAWTPDGAWILGSTMSANKSVAGIWKIRVDGSAHQWLWPGREISTFKCAPNGAELAWVERVTRKNETFYQGWVGAPATTTARLVWESKNEILKLDWSPTGKSVTMLIKNEDAQDLWRLDLTSDQRVKLNFTPVTEYRGWNGPAELNFICEYPDSPISLSEEQQDRQELLDGLQGWKHENVLISLNNGQLQRRGETIYAYQPRLSPAARGYFHLADPISPLSGGVYYPVLELSDGKKIYPVRTEAEHLYAAEKEYLTGHYSQALRHLEMAEKWPLAPGQIRSFFNLDSARQQLETQGDFSHFASLSNGWLDGSYYKTLLTLRKLNRPSDVDWLKTQFSKYIQEYFPKEHKAKDKSDEHFWTSIIVYSRYREWDAGIKDLESLLTANQDSTWLANINLAQAILAFETHQIELGLRKFDTGLKMLPVAQNDFKDVREIMVIPFIQHDPEMVKKCIPILENQIKLRKSQAEIAELEHLLGDFYRQVGQPKQACAAYQSALTHQFDDFEIWEKLYALEE